MYKNEFFGDWKKVKRYNLFQDIDDDGERGGANSQFNNNDDPEYFAYECLTIRDTEKLFQDEILALSEALKVSLCAQGSLTQGEGSVRLTSLS